MQTGYIFNFKDHGAFSPDGKVAEVMPQTEIDAHNRKLAQDEIEAMKATGRAVFYLRSLNPPGAYSVGTWEGSAQWPVHSSSKSRNNFGAQRTDVWFLVGLERWHGVNIGDNDIVRCKRTKGGAK